MSERVGLGQSLGSQGVRVGYRKKETKERSSWEGWPRDPLARRLSLCSEMLGPELPSPHRALVVLVEDWAG